jgi:hypothetical protein
MRDEFQLSVTYFTLCMNNNRDSAVGGFSIDVVLPYIIREDLAQFHNCR